MQRQTTKQKIQGYLLGRSWVSGTELESLAEDWMTKSSVITRRARELAHEGKIERELSNRKTVQYRLVMTSADEIKEELNQSTQQSLGFATERKFRMI